MNVGCNGQVDIPTFVTEKVLNTAMRHLHTCLLATREATSQRTCEKTLLSVRTAVQYLEPVIVSFVNLFI